MRYVYNSHWLFKFIIHITTMQWHRIMILNIIYGNSILIAGALKKLLRNLINKLKPGMVNLEQHHFTGQGRGRFVFKFGTYQIRVMGNLLAVIYTGQQKKGYKVICLLFYKTEWHILFVYCKHNVCCFRVDLPNLNQVQCSKTLARQFEWFCTTCTISQLLGTMEAK